MWYSCKILYLLHPNQNPLLNTFHFHMQKIHLHSQRSLLAVSPATETTHESHIAEQLGSWLNCNVSDFHLRGVQFKSYLWHQFSSAFQFPQSYQVYAGMVTQIKSWLFPSKSSPVHYSVTITSLPLLIPTWYTILT